MARPFDSNNYTYQGADGHFYAKVDGQDVGPFNNQSDAEYAYNARTATTTPQATTPTVAATTAPGTGTGVDPRTVAAAYELANAAATQAYNQAKLKLDATASQQLDERERIRLAQEAATSAWQQSIAQQGADVQRAVMTGYSSTAGAGTGDKINAAAADLRNNAAYQAAVQRGDTATKTNMEAGAIANATGLSMDRAKALYDQLGQRYHATGVLPTGAQIDQMLASNPQLAGTMTEAATEAQNKTALDYLTLRSQMAGRPEDAFTYASTIQNTPQSIRDTINAAAGRLNLPGLGFPPSGGGGAQQQSQVQANGGSPGATGANPNGNPTDGQSVTGPMYNAGGGDQTQAKSAALQATLNARQIAPQDYQRTNPYLQKMLWAGFGAAGQDPDAAKAMYQASLPRYSGPSSGKLAA